MSYIDVFSSNSVRDFFLAWQKSGQRRTLSVRELSKKLNYSSDRTLGMVIDGKRALSSSMIERIADQLKLSVNEKAYLQLLAQKDRSQKKNLSTEALEKKLIQLKPKSPKYVRLTESDLKTIEHWAFFVVLEVLRLSSQPMALLDLQERIPNLDRSNLNRILTTLSHLKFVEGDGKTYRPTSQDVYLQTEYDVPSTSIRKIHANQLERARVTLEEQSVLDREFITKTFRLHVEKLPELKRRLREVMNSIGAEFTEETDPQNVEVYQLGFQLFRQTHKKS